MQPRGTRAQEQYLVLHDQRDEVGSASSLVVRRHPRVSIHNVVVAVDHDRITASQIHKALPPVANVVAGPPAQDRVESIVALTSKLLGKMLKTERAAPSVPGLEPQHALQGGAFVLHELFSHAGHTVVLGIVHQGSGRAQVASAGIAQRGDCRMVQCERAEEQVLRGLGVIALQPGSSSNLDELKDSPGSVGKTRW